MNSTSPGDNDMDAGLDLDLRQAGSRLVTDVVFHPPRTKLLRHAEAAGCRTLDGLGMLVNQGAIAFRQWTGVEPDRGVMRVVLAGD